MVCAPLRDLRTQCVMFLLQSVQAILLCLEFGRQLDQLMGRGLQGFAGLIVGRDGLFHVQVKVVLPGVGATEVAEQVFEPLLAGLLLFAQLADVALQRAQLFKVVGVLDWKLNPQDAISLPNFGSRNVDTELETGRFSPALVQQLQARGHKVALIEMTSGTQIIMRSKDGWVGGADPRREGTALGD